MKTCGEQSFLGIDSGMSTEESDEEGDKEDEQIEVMKTQQSIFATTRGIALPLLSFWTGMWHHFTRLIVMSKWRWRFETRSDSEVFLSPTISKHQSQQLWKTNVDSTDKGREIELKGELR